MGWADLGAKTIKILGFAKCFNGSLSFRGWGFAFGFDPTCKVQGFKFKGQRRKK